MARHVTICGTQEKEVHIRYPTTASLAIFIRYASLDLLPCNVSYPPCLLSVKLTSSARLYTRYICANCDTALYHHLPLGSYDIVATIANTRYCTSYTLDSTSRIMLHALPIVAVCPNNCCQCCYCCYNNACANSR